MKRMPVAFIIVIMLGLAACDRGQDETVAAERDELRQQVIVLEERQQAFEAEREQIAAERQELQDLTVRLQEEVSLLQTETERLQEERAELQAQLENNLGAQLELVEVELEQARTTVEILERRRESLRERMGSPEEPDQRAPTTTGTNGGSIVETAVERGSGIDDDTANERAAIRQLATRSEAPVTDETMTTRDPIRILFEIARQRGVERGRTTSP